MYWIFFCQQSIFLSIYLSIFLAFFKHFSYHFSSHFYTFFMYNFLSSNTFLSFLSNQLNEYLVAARDHAL